jgi:XTP/dITP diphosphohydrolase
MKLVVATRNRGKLVELHALLSDLAVEPVSIVELRPDWQVDETGVTFEDNASLKARAAALATGMWALGDDSGLEVDALDGAPGVRSARYSAEHDDAANNQKLLRALTGVPPERRTARFRCALALTEPGGEVRIVRGACEGRIANAPRGDGGFGYDPLFEVDGQGGRTMAELAAAEKNRVSHRARALAALRGLLVEITA